MNQRNSVEREQLTNDLRRLPNTVTVLFDCALAKHERGCRRRLGKRAGDDERYKGVWYGILPGVTKIEGKLTRVEPDISQARKNNHQVGRLSRRKGRTNPRRGD